MFNKMILVRIWPVNIFKPSPPPTHASAGGCSVVVNTLFIVDPIFVKVLCLALVLTFCNTVLTSVLL